MSAPFRRTMSGVNRSPEALKQGETRARRARRSIAIASPKSAAIGLSTEDGLVKAKNAGPRPGGASVDAQHQHGIDLGHHFLYRAIEPHAVGPAEFGGEALDPTRALFHIGAAAFPGRDDPGPGTWSGLEGTLKSSESSTEWEESVPRMPRRNSGAASAAAPVSRRGEKSVEWGNHLVMVRAATLRLKQKPPAARP